MNQQKFNHSDLEMVILKTDWSDRENYFELRKDLRKQAKSLKALVIKEGVGWLKEQILESNLNDLLAWRVWLEWESAKKTSSFKKQQQLVIQQLPKPHGVSLITRHLLLSEKLPGAALLKKAFEDRPMMMLDALSSCIKKGTLTLSKVTQALGKSMDSESGKVLDWMILRVREGKLKGVYNLKNSNQLKPQFRAMLFQHPEKALLMTQALQLKLQMKPEFFPDSLYSMKFKQFNKEAKLAWENGDFGASSIQQWMSFAKNNVSLERELKKVFLKPQNIREPRTYFKETTKEYLKNFIEKKVFWIFLFNGSKPENRLELIENLDPELRKNWLKNIPAELIQNLLQSHKNIRQCPRTINLLQSCLPLRKVVNRDFLIQINGKDLPFERYWYLHGKSYRGLSKVKPCAENALNLLTGLPKDEQFLKNIILRYPYNKMIWKLRYTYKTYYSSKDKKIKCFTFYKTEDALAWLEPLRLKRLLRGELIHTVLLLEAVTKVRKSMPKKWLMLHAAQLIKENPCWLAKYLAEKMFQEEWQMIAAKGEFWEELSESPLLFMKHARISTWNLKDWQPPMALKKAASKNKELAKWCFEQNPKACWELAKKALPWWDRLPYALSHPETAMSLENEVPQKRWSEGLEKVKEHYPFNIAAAMELALHFGFRYGSFLAEVAREIKLGRDDFVLGCECDSKYHTYRIPKQSGGTRLITAPSKTLKHFQRAVVDLEMNHWPLEKSATGFRPGSSVVENALPHVGKRLVVNVDLKGFFPNTKFPLILKVLHHRFHGRFSPRAVRLLSVLCSYGGGLPTGAPTSPAIANQVLSSADKSISKAAQQKGVNYTRYADDLTLSGDNHAPLKLLPFLEEVIGKLGYELDPKKTNFFRKGRRQCVTGLVVNQKPNLAKPLRRRLRAAVHRYINNQPMEWHGRQMSHSQLLGRIGFLAQTQPEEAKCLRAMIEG